MLIKREINLNNIPRNKGDKINWKKSIGCVIDFTYGDIEGVIKIIDYDNLEYKVKIKYNENEFWMSTKSIKNCSLSNIVNKPSIKFTSKEIEILINNYENKSIKELLELLPNRTTRSIEAKSRELKLYKTKDRFYESKCENSLKSASIDYKKLGFNKASDYVKHNNANKIIYNNNLEGSFKQYKEILNGNRKAFKTNMVSKNSVIYLFKYFLKKSKINPTRDYFINVNFSDLCVKSKLDAIIQTRYSGYYDFICTCYPNFSFKPWEFKILDCENNYWTNKYNMYYHIREIIKKLFKDNIIETYSDIFKIPNFILDKYFHSSVNNFGEGQKHNIINYLNFIKVEYEINKLYDGQKFDSIQEIEIYKQLKNIFPNIIKNNNIRFYNEKHKEGYVPDFIYKNYIIEYFGMVLYKKDSIRNNYIEKTKRKTEYYNSLKEYKFIGLYPRDLYKNRILDKFKEVINIE